MLFNNFQHKKAINKKNAVRAASEVKDIEKQLRHGIGGANGQLSWKLSM